MEDKGLDRSDFYTVVSQEVDASQLEGPQREHIQLSQ